MDGVRLGIRGVVEDFPPEHAANSDAADGGVKSDSLGCFARSYPPGVQSVFRRLMPTVLLHGVLLSLQSGFPQSHQGSYSESGKAGARPSAQDERC